MTESTISNICGAIVQILHFWFKSYGDKDTNCTQVYRLIHSTWLTLATEKVVLYFNSSLCSLQWYKSSVHSFTVMCI